MSSNTNTPNNVTNVSIPETQNNSIVTTPISRLPIRRRYSLEFKTKVLTHLSLRNGPNGNISQCARDFELKRELVSEWNSQRDDIFASTL
jgi:transposase-like protein